MGAEAGRCRREHREAGIEQQARLCERDGGVDCYRGGKGDDGRSSAVECCSPLDDYLSKRMKSREEQKREEKGR